MHPHSTARRQPQANTTHTARPARNWRRSVIGSAALSVALALGTSPAANAQATTDYNARFLAQYNKIKNPANGYFSPEGVPYHSVETLIVEAPDHGHETTSEAYSYWLWLEANYGRVTGDWAPLNAAWANMEKYIIPAKADQPTNSFYSPAKPASYAGEYPLPSGYPSPLQFSVPVGKDPIGDELKTAYGNSDIYGMHWMLDVDNWYGFGRCGDGITKPAYINTFQRGAQESVWETIPQPSCETFKWGRTGGTQGFLSLFTGDSQYAKQWRYTNAPDADARAVQAIYWANVWATAQGKAADVADVVKKSAKMGDYLRYAMFDKYFKRIGNCVGVNACPGGTGATDASGFRDNQHYLMSWYYAWGGAADTSAGWAWRIGSSHNHFGYQNPLAAWALANQAAMKPLSPSAQGDWSKSLGRQMEFYRWLQSADGAIAGGATNSWNGNHETPPAGTPTFYGMFYDEKPVYHDPASNTWFGFQVWSMQRVAEYYYVTNNALAKQVLDKWVPWAIANTTLKADGTYEVPSTLKWSGAPDTWNAANPGANAGLRVTVTDFTNDVGVAASFARTLTYYAAKSNNAPARTMARELLDRMWTKYQTPKGVAVVEKRTDYQRFDDVYNSTTGDGVYVPPGWTGTNPQGATIDANSTFISIRPKYKLDPDWPKVQAYLDGGAIPTFTYHRFWAQADVAMAQADYGRLLGSPATPTIVVSPASITVAEGGVASTTVKLSDRPAANVTVALTKAAGGDADLSTATTALTFTPTNYATAQTVTVAAAQDADSTNGSARFNLTATGLTAANFTATERDDDVVAPITLVVSTAGLTVPEGSSATFKVRLSAAPTGNVTVQTARSSGDADISASAGATLTFTPANWATDQTVTLAAAEDADSANGTASFSVTATGSGVSTSRAVTATEQDNDAVVVPVNLVVSSTAVTVAEGATASFTVRLSAAPTGPVTVQTVRSTGDTDLGVSSGASLTFTPANWSTAQTVTLAAAEDADSTDGTASITVTASGSGVSSARSLSATEKDNDAVVTPGGCDILIDTSNDWGSGQVTRFVISNTGAAPLTNWSLSFTESNDFNLINGWSGVYSVAGRTVTITPASWNGTINPGSNADFGMQISYSGAKPVPTGAVLAGKSCTVSVK